MAGECTTATVIKTNEENNEGMIADVSKFRIRFNPNRIKDFECKKSDKSLA